jgi:2-iminobutanoate/2-iminopropanoate deaminase
MSNTDDDQQTEKPAKTYGPYSPVRQAGDFYFLSGHLGISTPEGTADPDVRAQTSQALKNISTTLETVGLGLEDIVKTTLFLTDVGDFSAVNEIYVEYFGQPRPARSAVGVKELPRVAGDTPLKIEIEAIAVRRP